MERTYTKNKKGRSKALFRNINIGLYCSDLGNCDVIMIVRSATAEQYKESHPGIYPDDYTIYFGNSEIGRVTFYGSDLIAMTNNNKTIYERRIPPEQIGDQRILLEFMNDEIRQFHLKYVRRLFMYKILNESWLFNFYK